jgi:hypothetical protein
MWPDAPGFHRQAPDRWKVMFARAGVEPALPVTFRAHGFPSCTVAGVETFITSRA